MYSIKLQKDLKSIIIKKFLKSIEIAFGKVLYWFFSLYIKNEALDGKVDISKIKKVLITRQDVIGDMLVTMPLFRYLKLLNPDIEIHVLASKSNHSLLKFDENVSKVFIYEPTFFKRLTMYEEMRSESYDLILVAYGLNLTKTGLMLHQISRKKTIKAAVFKKDRHRVFFNILIQAGGSDLNEWDKLKLLVTELFEQTTEFDFSLYLNTDDKSKNLVSTKLIDIGLESKGFILMNLTAGQERHEWTKEGFVELSKYICKSLNKPLLLSFMDQDKQLAESIQSEVKSDNLKAYPGSKDLIELAEVISRSEFVITPDTSVVHFASAMKRPILGLYMIWFGNKPWEPVGVPFRSVIAVDGENISSIKSKDVINALDELIDKIS